MSANNIPFDILAKILKTLPIKSLIQFRSVSKAWKSLIDSSDFIKHYSSQQQHLLLTYVEGDHNFKDKYVSIIDDKTFPKQRASITIPLLVTMLKFSRIVGSSHGLLCLFSRYCVGSDVPRDMAVLWNISVGKAVGVVVPNMGNRIYDTALGFGVCRETIDPKIVKVTYVSRWIGMESVTCIPRQVEVFTLSRGVWRSPYGNLPRKSIQFDDYTKVVIDGVFYWFATDGGFRSNYLIVSFDMTSEEFREISLPYSLAHRQCERHLSMSKLKESLVVLERDEDMGIVIVWIMEDGVSKSFTKLFTIHTPYRKSLKLHEFRKSGEPLLEVAEYGQYDYSSLVVYDPYSGHTNYLGINGTDVPSYMSYYMETLLLLDQPNFIIYEKERT